MAVGHIVKWVGYPVYFCREAVGVFLFRSGLMGRLAIIENNWLFDLVSRNGVKWGQCDF